MTPPAKKTAVPSLRDLSTKKSDSDEEKNQEDNTVTADSRDSEESSANKTSQNEGTEAKVIENKNEGLIEGDTKPETREDTTNDDIFLSDAVTHTKFDKTPNEMAHETPDESKRRHNIDTTINEEDLDNPNVQVYRDKNYEQIPSGTHLHPDIVKDLENRGITQHTTDAAVVRRTIEEQVFAGDAEQNDKF